MAEPDRLAVIADQEAEIKRLHDMLLDACEVFDRHDLPEYAFHYRRAVLGLEPAKAIARGEVPAPTGKTP